MSWKRPGVDERMNLFVDSGLLLRSGIVLDMGTGDGIFAKLLEAKYPTLSIYQSDLRRYQKNRPFILHSVSAPPFRARSLQHIFLGQVLHYLPSDTWGDVLKRLTTSLAPLGYLSIVEYETTRSFSWLPFPVSPEQIKRIANQLPLLKFYDLKEDGDKRRPKFVIILQKTS